MSDNELDGALEKLLEMAAGPDRDRLLSELDARHRSTVAKMLEIDDLVWESAHGAPPLQADPVAAMLGLIPDASFRLDASALKKHCSRKGILPTQLAARLRARGWKVGTAEVFRWQTGSASDVSPALIRAIADELSISPDTLMASPTTQHRALDTVAALVAGTKRFAALAQRFARVQGIPVNMAEAVLQTRMLATVQRGDQPEAEQILESLEALVHALEDGAST